MFAMPRSARVAFGNSGADDDFRGMTGEHLCQAHCTNAMQALQSVHGAGECWLFGMHRTRLSALMASVEGRLRGRRL